MVTSSILKPAFPLLKNLLRLSIVFDTQAAFSACLPGPAGPGPPFWPQVSARYPSAVLQDVLLKSRSCSLARQLARLFSLLTRFPTRLLYQFLFATLTNYHKLFGLKQHSPKKQHMFDKHTCGHIKHL